MDSLLQLDYYLFDLINQGLSNSLFDFLMPYVRNKMTWVPFYLLLLIIILYRLKAKGILLILLSVLLVGLTDAVSSHLLKNYFARTRPCLLQDFSNHVILVIEKCSGAYSFPSSHAANHMALAMFLSCTLFVKKRLLQIVILFWAILIGFAQIYVGVHFPSDIIAGNILGMILAVIFIKIYHKTKSLKLFT